MIPVFRNVLALDLATKTGWAVWSMGRHFASGVQEFKRYPGSLRRPKEHAGCRYARFQDWLGTMVRHYGITHIVVESALVGQKSIHSAQLSFALRAMVELAAHKNRMPEVAEYAPSSIKKWATGNGHAKKDEMVRRACELVPNGKRIVDDNEADACLLLFMYHALKLKEPIHANEKLPPKGGNLSLDL